MAVKKILLLGDPILRSRCWRVKDCRSASTRTTIRHLRDTLKDFRSYRGFGRGIAAPQIGVPVRIIYIGLNGLGSLINPRIVARSRKMTSLWDDCFSFPDILVRVKRHLWVEVAYLDEMGVAKKLRASDGLSELLQHEIDHVNGILAIDRAISTKHIVLRGVLRGQP